MVNFTAILIKMMGAPYRQQQELYESGCDLLHNILTDEFPEISKYMEPLDGTTGRENDRSDWQIFTTDNFQGAIGNDITIRSTIANSSSDNKALP